MCNIKLINASCAEQKVDAIVNAANKYLLQGGGICGVIFKKAGILELKNECLKINTPLNDGDAVITKSCNMKNCRYIIHAVGPDFSKAPDALKELENAYYNSLIILKQNDLHTISFPLISSGIFGYGLNNPVEESTKACIKAYNKFINNNQNYEISLLLCAYTKEEFEEAKKILK